MASANGNVVEITEANVEAMVVKSPLPVLLDFTAEWCQPCKAMFPTIVALAKEYEGKVTFGSVDVAKSPAVAAQFMVRGVPTLLIVRGGKVLGQLGGSNSKAKITELIKKAL
jgi:thioredoxin 1